MLGELHYVLPLFSFLNPSLREAITLFFYLCYILDVFFFTYQSRQQQQAPAHAGTSAGHQLDTLHPPEIDVAVPFTVQHSCDDLSAVDLVAGGHFGRPSEASVSSVSRRPSIFRRCYSSESNVLIPNWFASSPASQTAPSCTSANLYPAPASTTATVVASSSNPPIQQVDAVETLVDCLPPYYWEAKHMPRLVKVSLLFSLKSLLKAT